MAGGALTSLALGLPLLGGIRDYLFTQSRGAAVTSFHLAGASIVDVLGLFGSGRGWPFWLMAALFIVGAGAGCLHHRWFPFVAVAWLGLPFAILWLAQPHHMFIPRYVLFMQPVYLLVGAYGLTQVARMLTVAIATLVPRAGRTSSVGPQVCGALLAAVAAITFTPTWHSYGVEKINDWSAICTYLRKNVKPGDGITGNAYTQGIKSWLYTGTPSFVTRSRNASRFG